MKKLHIIIMLSICLLGTKNAYTQSKNGIQIEIGSEGTIIHYNKNGSSNNLEMVAINVAAGCNKETPLLNVAKQVESRLSSISSVDRVELYFEAPITAKSVNVLSNCFASNTKINSFTIAFISGVCDGDILLNPCEKYYYLKKMGISHVGHSSDGMDYYPLDTISSEVLNTKVLRGISIDTEEITYIAEVDKYPTELYLGDVSPKVIPESLWKSKDITSLGISSLKSSSSLKFKDNYLPSLKRLTINYNNLSKLDLSTKVNDLELLSISSSSLGSIKTNGVISVRNLQLSLNDNALSSFLSKVSEVDSLYLYKENDKLKVTFRNDLIPLLKFLSVSYFDASMIFHKKHYTFDESFYQLSNLNELHISGFDDLKVTIDDRVGSFKHLKKLQINQFNSFYNYTSFENLGALTELPKTFWSLKELEEINISISKVTEKDSFSSLPNLKKLTLAGCGDLEKIPSSISNCKSLRYLAIGHPKSLWGLEKLNSIKTLDTLRLYIRNGESGDVSAKYNWTEGISKLTNITQLDLMFNCVGADRMIPCNSICFLISRLAPNVSNIKQIRIGGFPSCSTCLEKSCINQEFEKKHPNLEIKFEPLMLFENSSH